VASSKLPERAWSFVMSTAIEYQCKRRKAERAAVSFDYMAPMVRKGRKILQSPYTLEQQLELLYAARETYGDTGTGRYLYQSALTLGMKIAKLEFRKKKKARFGLKSESRRILMAKRYCDGCGIPLGDRQSVCSQICLEKIRARIQGDEPRLMDEILHADNVTKGARFGDPLKNGHLTDLPKIYRDVEHSFPDAARVPLVLNSNGPVDGKNDDSVIYHMISTQPWISFVGECFRVDPECASYFEMTPLYSANLSAAAGETGYRYMPCSLFDQWKRMDLAVLNPSNKLSFTVRNTSSTARIFKSVLFGRVVQF
jgi:hypothetical protein